MYDGKILQLYVDDVETYNGIKTKREFVAHHGGAAILFFQNNKILLERQFRYAYKEEVWEIPAGKLEKDEDPKEAAIRELEEETGYKANKIENLGVIYPSVGYTNEKIYLYAVSDAYKTSTNFDKDEFIESAFFSIEEVKQMIQDGTIKDTKTICALFYYLNR